jgi:hypothetical protein
VACKAEATQPGTQTRRFEPSRAVHVANHGPLSRSNLTNVVTVGPGTRGVSPPNGPPAACCTPSACDWINEHDADIAQGLSLGWAPPAIRGQERNSERTGTAGFVRLFFSLPIMWGGSRKAVRHVAIACKLKYGIPPLARSVVFPEIFAVLYIIILIFAPFHCHILFDIRPLFCYLPARSRAVSCSRQA